VPLAVLSHQGQVLCCNRAWGVGEGNGDGPWFGLREGDRLPSTPEGPLSPISDGLRELVAGQHPASRIQTERAPVQLIALEGGVGILLLVEDAHHPGGRRSGVEDPGRSLPDREADAVFLLEGRSRRILEADEAMTLLTGYLASDLVGMALEEVVVAPARGEFMAAVARVGAQGRPALFETLLGLKGGGELPVEMSLHLHGKERIQGLIRDISLRKDLEDQLRTAQRIESIGRLAGGVAHDFNNLITVISGHTDLLLSSLPAGSAMEEDALEIRNASRRAADLTRQLLAFSRRQLLQSRIISLNEVLARMETMLSRIIGEDVELVILPAPDLGTIRADPGQVEQVILNLVVNSRDAMPGGGELAIRTGNVELDGDFVRRHLGSRAGPHVMLEVRDTGEGMTPEVMSQVFDPFFTTKEPGKGTGLGLAMVYGIVKQSGGYITVESEPDVGTALALYFPRLGESPSRGQSPPEAAESMGGTETILLVEDEAMVRSLASRVLGSLGYRVLEAADAQQALRIAQEVRAPIDLLLSDVVMPRLGGRELARLLSGTRPGIRVLLMSGYSDDAVLRQGALEPGQGFLQKPFTPATLSARVREVLDGDPSGGRLSQGASE